MSEPQPEDRQSPEDRPSEAPTPARPESKQKAIDALCDSFARDEMEIAELETRIELVHLAETAGQLQRILADIPAAPPPAKRGAAKSGAVTRPLSSPSDLAPRVTRRATPPEDRIPLHSLVVGVMGGGGRAGSWIPARVNWAVGVMGGCQLDFREAQLGPGVTEVRVLAVMGGIEILAPPDVRVDCSGIGIMGGFGIGGQYRPPTDPDAPMIRVTGLAVMGGAGVTIRNPGESASDARLRLKEEKQARKLLKRGEE